MGHTPPLDFILKHKVFRLEELQAAYRDAGCPEKSARNALKYHLKVSRICRVRRGVYAHLDWVDPWLIAAKLADPVVISHDGALSFHSITGVGHSLTFLTTARATIARHEDIVFTPLLVDQSRMDWAGAEEHQREGQKVFVTSLAASLVDCLALLARSPPLDELMAAFKEAKRRKVKARAMIQHALRYESPLLCSRLGFFLTCADFWPEEGQRDRLQAASARELVHFQRSKAKRSDRSFPPWNIIVPAELYAFLPGEGA